MSNRTIKQPPVPWSTGPQGTPVPETCSHGSRRHFLSAIEITEGQPHRTTSYLDDCVLIEIWERRPNGSYRRHTQEV